MTPETPKKWEEYFAFRIITINRGMGVKLYTPEIIFGDGDFFMTTHLRFRSKRSAAIRAEITIKELIKGLRAGDIEIQDRDYI